MSARLSIGVALLALTAACGDDEFGEGTRRPPTVITPRPSLVSLAITEVFLGDGGTGAFVELLNDGGGSITLGDRFELVSSRGAPVSLTGAIASGERIVVQGTEVAALLSPTSGEVAVRDSDDVVHAYVAWGGDPGARGSLLYGEAFSAGVPLADPPSLGAPFPLDPTLALVFESPSGCAAPSAGAAATGTSACPAGDGAVTLTEVFVGDGLTWIELRNDSTSALSLDDVRVCSPPSCAPIVAATGELDSGDHAVVLVDANVADLASLDLGTVFAGGSAFGCGETTVCASVGLSPLTLIEELVIARPGDLGVDGAELLGYLRYGVRSSAELQADAVAAGLWATGAVTAAPDGGQSLQLASDSEVGPVAWTLGSPSPGVSLNP